MWTRRRVSALVLVAAGSGLLLGSSCSSKLTAEECLRKSNEALSRIGLDATPEQLQQASADLEKLNQELTEGGCPDAIADR